ncbi:MAG TPA: EamA family transporter [Firmicutes bacterium]|nr:EamA family transporter [Bacillota bacterium]
MSTVFLALIGAICWGIAPIFGKLGLTRLDAMSALCIRTLMAGLVVIFWVFMSGQLEAFKHVLPRSCIFIALEAILATLVGDLAYYAALKRGNAGPVMFIMSTSPLVTLVIAVLFLGENPSWAQVIGGLLIVCGLLLIAGPR